MIRSVPNAASWSRRVVGGLYAVVIPALLWLAAPPPVSAQQPPDGPQAERLGAMQWRLVGPFRGGRSVAVSGVAADPAVYYFGAAGGGLWKTTDRGETWSNVSDGYFRTGSVGAVAVAESDPNVVYVGMGEHAVRGVANSHGDGVYRSTDAGRTWTHLGLERTRQISRIRVHPRDPDLVYVAAQGAPGAPTEERGIYRSRDGGATWQRVHFVSETAGAADLAMDMTNPRILYAAYWDHLRLPWQMRSGGEGSGIWKSRDGGDTWERLGNGLPALMGKIGVDVSRANPDRVFAIVEAESEQGGLYRSDDGGRSWRHVNASREIQTRSWYYMEVFADPNDENTVVVLNAPFLRSVDAGEHFSNVPVPHGDNHDLWINPNDSDIQINANDGGANITFNGGRSWSTQQNQPTAQFYRVITDHQFPYHIYGGQQDNSAIGIASAAPGGITWSDFYSVSGCESAYLAFDPDDPRDVFGGCYQGLIDRWSRQTLRSKPVMAYPFLGLGTYPQNQKYRFNWNAPIVSSPHDARVLYHAGNVLLQSTDRGQSWEEISPDLTRNELEKQGAGGAPFTNEGAGGENYNTIMYVIESPHEVGVLWAGSDDGLVHLTRDGGANWVDVTPDDIGEGIINSIEVSRHDPARAYVVATRYKFNDFRPLIFRTEDYGRSWDRIVRGIPDEHWVRVVREDPLRAGVLYAGTEMGMFLSLDDGEHWERFQLNLPIVPVTDLAFQGNDLIAATQGRGFWVLDDLSPLQQLGGREPLPPMTLLAPRPAALVAWGGGGDGRAGQNPPTGPQIFYHFANAPDSLLTLEILDGEGRIVRAWATDPERAGLSQRDSLPAPHAGLNRFAWDFRHQGLEALEGYQHYGSLNGRVAAPGSYQVRLTHGPDVQTAMFDLLPDPRWQVTTSDFVAQDRFLAEAQALVGELYESVRSLATVSEQVDALIASTGEHPRADTIRTAGEALVEKITGWEDPLVQRRQKTFQDVINFTNRLDAQVLELIASVDGTEPPLTQGAQTRLRDVQREWAGHRAALESLLANDVAAFNRLIRELGIDPIVVPPRTERRPVS